MRGGGHRKRLPAPSEKVAAEASSGRAPALPSERPAGGGCVAGPTRGASGVPRLRHCNLRGEKSRPSGRAALSLCLEKCRELPGVSRAREEGLPRLRAVILSPLFPVVIQRPLNGPPGPRGQRGNARPAEKRSRAVLRMREQTGIFIPNGV